MATTTLSKKYQVVIPKEIRKRMRLHAGVTVAMHALDDGRAVLVKHPMDPVKAMRGLGKDIWHALGGTVKYIKTERATWR